MNSRKTQNSKIYTCSSHLRVKMLIMASYHTSGQSEGMKMPKGHNTIKYSFSLTFLKKLKKLGQTEIIHQGFLLLRKRKEEQSRKLMWKSVYFGWLSHWHASYKMEFLMGKEVVHFDQFLLSYNFKNVPIPSKVLSSLVI